MKEGILKGSLKLVPRIIDHNALAFLIFKSLHHAVDSDTLQQDSKHHQDYDGSPHYLSSRQKGRRCRRIRTTLFGVDHLADLRKEKHDQEVQRGQQPSRRSPASTRRHRLLSQPRVHISTILFPRDHLSKLLDCLLNILLETQRASFRRPHEFQIPTLGFALGLERVLLGFPLRCLLFGFLKHALAFFLNPCLALCQALLLDLGFTVGTRILVFPAFRRLHGCLCLLNGNVHYL